MKYDIKIYPEDELVHIEVNSPSASKVPVSVCKEVTPPEQKMRVIEVPPKGPGVVKEWKFEPEDS